jgi:hypothetical protein
VNRGLQFRLRFFIAAKIEKSAAFVVVSGRRVGLEANGFGKFGERSGKIQMIGERNAEVQVRFSRIRSK